MDKTLDLSALHAFRAVVHARSFSGAAAALNIPKSTVSKHVADLEADLGIRLIERTTRAFHITPEGEVLSARAEGLLGEADDLRRSLMESGGAVRGHLRIAVPQLIGNLYWGRIAAGFRTAFPDITLECHFLDRAPDLLQEGFDGAIRFGPIEEGGLIARVMGESHGIVVASPQLFGIDGVTEPLDLLKLPLVGYATPWPGGWTLVSGSRIVEVPAIPDLRLGSPLAVRDAVQSGAGAAVIPAMVASPEISAGCLFRLLPEWSTARKPIVFVYPTAQSMTARLRALIDWTAKAMKQHDQAAPSQMEWADPKAIQRTSHAALD